MKKLTIVHVALASSFTETMTYQENLLTNQNILDGHSVVIITNTSKFVDGKLVDTPEEDTLLENGLRLIRLGFDRYFTKKISEKIRRTKRLYSILVSINPDIIFSHSTSYCSLIDCVNYIKKFPNTHLVADNHATIYNSGKSFFSRFFLHRFLYKRATKKAIPFMSAYYYIGLEEKDFAIKEYGVPESLMKFFPLGGKVLNDDDYFDNRSKIRAALHCSSETIVFMHSGKFDKRKKTRDLIDAFLFTNDRRFKLVIIGKFENDDESSLLNLIRYDERIVYLGWKTSDELMKYLCACDVYCQPGSVSATLQNSICCRCAVLSYPHMTYVNALNEGNFYFVRTKDEISSFFRLVENNQIDIQEMCNISLNVALKILDYKRLAELLYDDCGFSESINQEDNN